MRPSETGRLLLEIQELDTTILGLRRDIEGLEEKHELALLRGRVEDAGERLASTRRDLAEVEKKQRKLDGELSALTAKVKVEEEKLFSGTVMNPKELSAIQAEIFSLRKRADEMETEDLEEMEGIDGLEAEVKKGGEELAGAAAEEERRKAEYRDELAALEERIAQLEAERDALKAEVEAETLVTYEELLGKKGGLAVVRIEQGRNCGGCHIEFSRTQIDRFQHEDAIFRCDYCRRILVR